MSDELKRMARERDSFWEQLQDARSQLAAAEADAHRLRLKLVAVWDREAELRRVLRHVYALLDDCDQGPRAESGEGWSIPWTRYAVEVFGEVAAVLTPPASTAARVQATRDDALEEAARVAEIATLAPISIAADWQTDIKRRIAASIRALKRGG